MGLQQGYRCRTALGNSDDQSQESPEPSAAVHQRSQAAEEARAALSKAQWLLANLWVQGKHPLGSQALRYHEEQQPPLTLSAGPGWHREDLGCRETGGGSSPSTMERVDRKASPSWGDSLMKQPSKALDRSWPLTQVDFQRPWTYEQVTRCAWCRCITTREVRLLLWQANTHHLKEDGTNEYCSPPPVIRQGWAVQRWEQLKGSKPRHRIQYAGWRWSLLAVVEYERVQQHELGGETQWAAGTSVVVLRGEHIPAAGYTAEVQMQAIQPSLPAGI